MNVLIELYDERAIENIIGPETFRPAHVIYLCPPHVYRDRDLQEKLKAFFVHRGLNMTVEFQECSVFKADKILLQLKQIAAKHPDLVMDITGGTDAALFASGMFCREMDIPAFTYSRRKNRFYEIHHAPFADEKPCELTYNVEDFFLMAGGTMRQGRVDNRLLAKYMDQYVPFFKLFLRHRKNWVRNITYLQRISQTDPEAQVPLRVCGSFLQKGERGDRIGADRAFLNDLEQLGWIHDLVIENEERCSFCFQDHQIREWLRDVGSVLELYMYKICIDSDLFQDVISSAVVDWDGRIGHGSVSNEIDVMATRGTAPVFISCKACEIKTPAINELAILRDRFGGKGAKAIIVTTEHCNAAARHRAAQLDMAVIDLEELECDLALQRLKVIMKVQQTVRGYE